ncbi:chromosome segregation protein SMC [Allochromatium vinosum]|uniref:Chromosome partition protein Smc n=1 Tax=Allochromatium vinosum (strain ATCC 17899 / DSM 180 / NBRC 103801 / NCIMB 10441 / D) TaxID=572477 RepID=D3RSW0_ALLVD|nr:chromosome segregation protein SMC [Allochromatium vinosum]ADC62269.1 chromosome segregation protein SMC [Allochromatium vinosum DSM 180]
MRLERIKLAGFKSFVDPTTVHFPSNLVGIVGPNGCGKSNVIDAVRWVMGESSAKMLRGESMADVIFNGSTGRKPVGVASIELIFDNSDGGAEGEYAAFDQISVKRQVARDGQSSYFLNGTRCRRRDIQDLFLGTGLGPRSYAIIEQGMISRIIEARPEDLRLFLEEAAGISKYKERRRETENRMRHTRENLDRLNDVREEVGKQLLHLERQAATAEKYTQLRAEERRLDLELKALRWRALDDELQALSRRLAEAENQGEAGLAEQRRLEAEIESKREAYNAASDDFNAIQGRYYAVGAEIARAEQAIQFANEERGRREAELVRLDQELYEAGQHLERDRERLTEIARALAEDEPQLEQAESELSEATGSLMTLEDQLKSWESEWDAFNAEAARPSEQAQLERARLTALEQAQGRERERRRRIEEERARLDASDVSARLEELSERESVLDERIEALEDERDAVLESLAGHETALRALADTLDQVRTRLREAKGRLASLTALQESALADTDVERRDWLASRGLAGAARLVEQLKVEPGWERAVEIRLGQALRAVTVDALETAVADANELPPGLVLLETAGDPGSEPEPETGYWRLGQRAQSPWPIGGLLGPTHTVAHLREALAARHDLSRDATLITPEGIEVGRHWLRVPERDGASGVLERAETIAALESELAALADEEAERLDEELELRDARTDSEQRRLALESELTGLERERSALRSELSALRTRVEHQSERRRALDEEWADLERQSAESLAEMEDTRERLHDWLDQMETLAEQRVTLEQERTRLRTQVAESRERERTCRDRAQSLRIRVESNRAAREATRQSQTRAQAQQTQLLDRRDELIAALEEGVEPLAEQRERLDEHLVRRVEVEDELQEARQRRETLEAEVRTLEQSRQRAEQAVQANQRGLDTVRLERQERLVRQRTLEEQFAELGASQGAILESLDPAATETVWQEELSKVAARIQRLGAVNLAAVDEFKEQSERKTYLDAQHDDIARSLETLEQAIRKIDRETRSRFKETYDQVDQGFQQLFPRLFGGGQAYLELTDEDLLETGVSVMARPPGKRNASIHLLSGGEKALTAVALVFAIFQLNPAPFCMLDEVDAPLDDANVGRFCELVRAMSDQVQFIFISHNKVTMEIAHHLMGVTMHEPGVSRLVSVDVDEAVRLAAVA